MKRIALLSTALAGAAAHAHDGHGLFGAHWHATDVAGLVFVGALAALVIWLSSRGD